MPASYALAGKRVWVAGHRGMVGSALVRRLKSENCEVLVATRKDVDLIDQAQTRAWIAANRPDAIIVAAAKVGGILANDTRPADFLYDNLMIEANVIQAAFTSKVEKLLLLGSSCIYPRLAPQPIPEESLLTGPLEPTNEWYAIAKIAGIKLCQAYRRQHGSDFISAMPTNLYGPEDNFDLTSSHVIPALMRKAHQAKLAGDKTMTIWGTGTPLREFMHVDDCADALVHILKTYSDAPPVNIGFGEDVSIADLTRLVAAVVGFQGEVVTDPSKPDGTPRKLMDSTRLFATGWRPRIDLRQGLSETYQCSSSPNFRARADVMWKIAVQALLFMLPWGLRRRLLNAIFKYEIAPTARIGFSILTPRMLRLGPQAYIGHLNFCQSLSLVALGKGAIIGNLNWICGPAENHPVYFPRDVGRYPALILDEYAGVAHRHLLDCTDTVRIGTYTTVAGWGSQIITHGVDVAANRNRAGRVSIGKYCLIGTGAIILKGAELPDFCILGAGSVLTKACTEKYALYSGNPAVKVRDLDPQSLYFSRQIPASL